MNETPTVETYQDEFLIGFPSCVDIIKSESGLADERKIGGTASTASLDRQNEIVVQRGLDFSEFVQHGYFNDNHRQVTSAAVGIPERAVFKGGNGWYVEGYLIKDYPPADEIWALAKALSPTPRRLGFSIEGKILKREDNRVLKARVRHVAITNSPVNTDCTWDTLAKALSVGYARGAGGRILVPESLEREADAHSFTCPACQKSFGSSRALDGHLTARHPKHAAKSINNTEVRRLAKALTREQAIVQVRRLRPHLTEATAARVVDLVLAGGVK